jgi:NAD(P)-dependent dehydrogenase (short-subunit alcohol dehydrogenase family)
MKVVVIGADKGIGEALARLLLENGHSVGVGLFSGDKGSGTPWEHECRENALLLHTDVNKEESVIQAAKKAHEVFGELDAVIDVAGILTSGDRVNSLLESSLDELRLMFDVNALGIITVFRGFYPFIKKDGSGKFIAVTAAGGVFCEKTLLFPGYHISKVAANKVVQILKDSIDDITILALHPGRVNTEMGRTTAQIEPEDSAAGIYNIVVETKALPNWFIDYRGNALPL